MFNLIDFGPTHDQYNSQDPLNRCLPYFHWQDFQAIGNNTHPLWVPADDKCADNFKELAFSFQHYDVNTGSKLIKDMLLRTTLLVRPESDWRACKRSNLELNCEVQCDAGLSFRALGPLGYSEHVPATNDGFEHIILGWEINPLSRNWLGALFSQNVAYVDFEGRLLRSRTGEWNLNYTLVPNCTLYVGTFRLGGSHWMEAMEKMYQCVYCNGSVCRKWRELG